MLIAEELARIIEVLGDIAELGLDLDGVMNLAVKQVMALVGADGAAIELAEGDTMVYRAASGIAAGRVGTRMPVNGSLTGLCLRSSQPQICDDAEADARVDLDACRAVGLRSMVVVPLLHEGLPVGVLKAMAGETGRFGAHDAELLGQLSRLVGTSMYWATRYGRDDLYRRATHDELTGLANRSLLMDRLRHAVAQAERHGDPVGLIVLDMDGLKRINDRLGHAAGDAALVEFARRIRRVARGCDTVARLGGDEFAIVLAPSNGPDEARGLIARLDAALRAPHLVGGAACRIEASCGSAHYPTDARDLAALLECADRRMYEAKRRRHGREALPADMPADTAEPTQSTA